MDMEKVGVYPAYIENPLEVTQAPQIVNLSKEEFSQKHPKGQRLDGGEGSTGVKVYEDVFDQKSVVKAGPATLVTEAAAIALLTDKQVEASITPYNVNISVEKANGNPLPEVLARYADNPELTAIVLRNATVEILDKISRGYANGVRLVDINWSQIMTEMEENPGESKWMDYGGAELGKEKPAALKIVITDLLELGQQKEMSALISHEGKNKAIDEATDLLQKGLKNDGKNWKDIETGVMYLLTATQGSYLKMEIQQIMGSEEYDQVMKIIRDGLDSGPTGVSRLFGKQDPEKAFEVAAESFKLIGPANRALARAEYAKWAHSHPDEFVEQTMEYLETSFGKIKNVPVKEYADLPWNKWKADLHQIASSIGTQAVEQDVNDLVASLKSEMTRCAVLRVEGVRDDVGRLRTILEEEFKRLGDAGDVYPRMGDTVLSKISAELEMASQISRDIKSSGIEKIEINRTRLSSLLTRMKEYASKWMNRGKYLT